MFSTAMKVMQCCPLHHYSQGFVATDFNVPSTALRHLRTHAGIVKLASSLSLFLSLSLMHTHRHRINYNQKYFISFVITTNIYYSYRYWHKQNQPYFTQVQILNIESPFHYTTKAFMYNFLFNIESTFHYTTEAFMYIFSRLTLSLHNKNIHAQFAL